MGREIFYLNHIWDHRWLYHLQRRKKKQNNIKFCILYSLYAPILYVAIHMKCIFTIICWSCLQFIFFLDNGSWHREKGLTLDPTVTDIAVFDEMRSNNQEKEFDYLLNMSLSSLTSEKISDLRNEADKMDSELDEACQTSSEDLLPQDLGRLEIYLKTQLYWWQCKDSFWEIYHVWRLALDTVVQ